MKEKSVCISIKYKNNIKQEGIILFFTELLKNKFDKTFDEFHYTITDKNKSSWKQYTKSGNFTPNRFAKFIDLQKNLNDDVYIDFELLTNLKNYVFKSRDIDASFSCSQSRDIKSLDFIFNAAWISQSLLLEFISSTVLFIESQSGETIYGYVLELANEKMPALYMQGISNIKLGKKEEGILYLWSTNLANCESKIIDIFWGNIISSKHIIGDETLKNIQEIVGAENVMLLTENIIWFNINESISDFEILKYSNQRKKLIDYFK